MADDLAPNSQTSEPKSAARAGMRVAVVSLHTSPTATLGHSADTAFDDCGKESMKEIVAAVPKGAMVGSFTHGHAAPAAVKQAGYDVVAAVFTGQYDSAQAVKELVKAVAAAKE